MAISETGATSILLHKNIARVRLNINFKQNLKRYYVNNVEFIECRTSNEALSNISLPAAKQSWTQGKAQVHVCK